MWRVEDGVIVGGQDGDPKKSGLLCTKDSFKDFELTLEFMVLFGSLSGTLGNVGQADYFFMQSTSDAIIPVRRHYDWALNEQQQLLR